MAVLVDTNVLIDVAVRDPQWSQWSRRAISQAAREHDLLVNQIVYAELSLRYERPEDLDAALDAATFARENLPWDAAFLAGRAFLTYRRHGGSRERPLPDFFIGAHAAVRGHAVITRDPRGFRTYFPTVALITPDTHP
jgi:hypothetical protein